MNAYEQDVIALHHHRRRLRMRVATLLAVAVVIVAALWAAGVPMSAWLTSESKPSAAPVVAPLPPPVMLSPVSVEKPELADDGAVGKLRLVATEPGRNAREGTARIATGAANPLTYVTGALLANGAVLVEVHADHILLDRDGKSTELYVDGMARNTKSRPVLEELITVTPAPRGAKQAPARVNPETYTHLVRAVPRFDGKTIAGFEVYAGTDAFAFARLDLRTGDVLMALDGKTLTSVEDLHRGLKAVNEGASVMATVQRDGAEIVVNFDGAALKARDLPMAAGVPGR